MTLLFQILSIVHTRISLCSRMSEKDLDAKQNFVENAKLNLNLFQKAKFLACSQNMLLSAHSKSFEKSSIMHKPSAMSLSDITTSTPARSAPGSTQCNRI